MNPSVATEKWGSSLCYKGLLSAEYVSLYPLISCWCFSLANPGQRAWQRKAGSEPGEANRIIRTEDTDPRVLEKQELQQPTYVALSYINRFMTDAARREQESLKKKIQPKLSLTLSSSVSRGNVSTPPRHSSGSLTPPVTPPITPSSSFRSSTPTGSEYDEEEVDYEESDSDESWTTESAISSEAILSSMCMNGGEEKPFACPVPGCKKRYKNVNGIKYHAKNGHRTQIRVRKPFKCRCGKSYKTAQGLRHHTINFHPPVSAEIIRKMQQ
ncbi:juxtaposed with another zinc finger protein 1 isoform X1 [Odocoileus virginianus]|uniref:Juxtaposed with another zinc finger protein 1 isoform X1 n=1 Tax=Odocoileus virginianus TaxID=9874 RepID=A0ABM4I7Y9_ODOVR